MHDYLSYIYTKYTIQLIFLVNYTNRELLVKEESES
jgi:hypothetical protein